MFRILKRIFLIGLATAIVCLLYGFLIEPNRLVKRAVDIDSPLYDGPALKILLLSDMHIGGLHIDSDRVSKIVARVNQDGPYDYVLIPGDFIDGHERRSDRAPETIAEIETGIAHLGDLNGGQNIYASLGNHDTWYGKAAVTDMLLRAGAAVLDNKSASKNNLCIVGIADFDTARPSPKAGQNCTAGQTKIVITHSPDALKFAPKDSALIVAGHTHGGQINIPLIGRRVTATRAGRAYAYGLKTYDGMPVFITAGIGTSMLPARFRAPPEYVVVTLRAAK